MTSSDYPGKTNTIAYPHVFFCGGCNHRHIAISFVDSELEYLQYILETHRDFLEQCLGDETDREECKNLTDQIEMTDELAEIINDKECNCDLCDDKK